MVFVHVFPIDKVRQIKRIKKIFHRKNALTIKNPPSSIDRNKNKTFPLVHHFHHPGLSQIGH